MDVEDKNVIVTGGVSGIGRAIVSKLAAAGAKVGIFDLDTDPFSQVEQSYENVRCLACDVSDAEQVASAVDAFFQEAGEIHALVNNAGILYSAPLLSFSAEGLVKHEIRMWEKVIATDLSSVFYMTLHVAEKMVLKRTKGVIINISSISAQGNAGQSAYSAAKAGVNALTTTWAKELGLHGIRVVGVAPGFFDTESTHRALSQDHISHITKEVPLRRLGKSEEIAQCVKAALQNDYMSGTTIEIDGGLTI